jgi:glycosyltransferase involved in cell wall biosynthesis
MNLLIDLTPAARPALTGVGVYAVHLGKELQKLPDVNLTGSYKISRWKRAKFIKDHIKVPLVPELPYYPELLKPNSQIYHGTDFRIPRLTNLATVVTVHDLVVFQKGLSDEGFAEKSQQNFLHMIKKCRPQHVITVSHAVATEFEQLCPEYHGRITAIHSGIDHLPQITRTPAKGPVILCIGTVERRKNLLVLIQAFEQIIQSWPDATFIIAGGDGNGAEEVKKAIAQSPARNQIKRFGFITNEHRNKLYAEATVFVYASLYEGFGLPVLEAMRAGCPVITSNTGAQAEVAGDAAILINPNQADDLAQKLETVLQSPQKQKNLSEDGIKHSAAFTWERCAKETAVVYEQLLRL